MIKNYFKLFVRNLFRNKVFSIINISGLAIGMASAILILLWVQNETNYDRFHANAKKLFEVCLNDSADNSAHSILNTPKIMASFLKKNLPEIENVSRVSWDKKLLLSVDDKSLMAIANTVDASFLSMFSFPLLKGNVRTALNDPNSIVLTEKLAKKLFGNEDAMGKVMKMENVENYKVTGILKDLPNNTLFNFEYLTSYDSKAPVNADWTIFTIRTFVLLKSNTFVDAVNEKIKSLIWSFQSIKAAIANPVKSLRTE